MTEPESFLDGKVILHPGDCLYALRDLDSNSIDSCVTDPPYELKFMGKAWDGTGIAFQRDTWARVFRVLKPGAHLLAFGGTRTYHRMACAIEDAGFEIRDSITNLIAADTFVVGFMQSLNDEQRGAFIRCIDESSFGGLLHWVFGQGFAKVGYIRDREGDIVREGWGGSLKPACEPICLARKPLSESNIAANVLKWGTGALNIDGCRVATDESTLRPNGPIGYHGGGAGGEGGSIAGRWPANVILEDCDEVVGAFPDAPGQSGTVTGREPSSSTRNTFALYNERAAAEPRNDTGSAARFFYTAKADSDDRLGSRHPTVKPLDLIEYLERLVTPPGGTILDPFAGTGTAGEAAWRMGFKAILIEREEEYCNDIRRRMALCLSGPGERKRESTKARLKDKPEDHGPLFAESAP